MGKRVPKRQHYVPKFYLKEFSTAETYGLKDKAQIHIYDIEQEEQDVRNIKTVAYGKYLYSPIDENDDRSSYMEDKLSELENLLSKIWPELANNTNGLSSSYKKGIALFIFTLMLRHPDNLYKNEQSKQFLRNEIIKNIPEGTTKFMFVVDGKENVVDIEDVISTKNESAYDSSMFFIENIEMLATKMVEILIKKKWSIIVSEEKKFITSDRPVIISNPETGFLGIDAKGVIISLPLSPTRLLLLEDNIDDEIDVTYYPLNKGHSAHFNSPIWSNAYRYVIAHRNLEEVSLEIFDYKAN